MRSSCNGAEGVGLTKSYLAILAELRMKVTPFCRISSMQGPIQESHGCRAVQMIYIRNGAAFYRQVATAVNPDEPPFDFVEPQRVEENKSPPDRPVKPVPMVRKKRGLPPGFAATVNREPTSASPENETPDPFPQPAAEAIPMFKEVSSASSKCRRKSVIPRLLDFSYL